MRTSGIAATSAELGLLDAMLLHDQRVQLPSSTARCLSCQPWRDQEMRNIIFGVSGKNREQPASVAPSAVCANPGCLRLKEQPVS